MTLLILAMLLFVGTHFLLSHPLRAPIVGIIGERPFLGLYSLVAVAALGLALWAYGGAPTERLWYAPTWLVAVGHLVMLAASILFAGAFMAPNPALVGAGGLLDKMDAPRGAMRITRHPLMWSFALWALAHILHTGRLETFVLAFGIGFLALVGAAMQDRKKRALLGAAWADYAAKTSYWPRPRWPGLGPVAAGLVLYALLVGAHPHVIGVGTRTGELL